MLELKETIEYIVKPITETDLLLENKLTKEKKIISKDDLKNYTIVNNSDYKSFLHKEFNNLFLDTTVKIKDKDFLLKTSLEIQNDDNYKLIITPKTELLNIDGSETEEENWKNLDLSNIKQTNLGNLQLKVFNFILNIKPDLPKEKKITKLNKIMEIINEE
jgi:hypothetical protein